MEEYYNDWQSLLPIELREQIASERWQTINIGQSGMHVFRAKDGFLKINEIDLHAGEPALERPLQSEEERLRWLKGRLPVPHVHYYGSDERYEYLLTSEVAGIMACDPLCKEDMSALIRLLAEALHMVHAVDFSQCPFDQRIDSRLAAARKVLFAEGEGEISEQMQQAREHYQLLLSMRPAAEDLALTHGDFCLPNIVIDWQHKQISGFIDLGLMGVADRYRDVERACWSLSYNFAEAWVPELLKEYGLEHVDQEKMAFYRQLEWLF